MTLTQAQVRELFDYDPETGIVTRLLCTANRQTIGEVVGSLSKRGYLIATIAYRKYPLHRLIWLWVHGHWPKFIDHRNRVRTDNRFQNLRDVTKRQNSQNQSLGRRNTSGYQGVSWDKSKQLWLASIGHNGKLHYLGRYSTPQQASSAYQAAKSIYHPTAPQRQI